VPVPVPVSSAGGVPSVEGVSSVGGVPSVRGVSSVAAVPSGGAVPRAVDARLLPLWRAVHDRLSSGQSVSSIKVGAWDADQREALADLLGLDRVPPVGAKLPMAKLELALAATGRDLRSTVEELLGPLDDRKARQARAVADRDQLWSWLSSHPIVKAEPVLQNWVSQIQRGGLINQSADGTRAILQRALDVLEALPADGVPLPIFADRILGDPHALDDGERLTGIVLRALACLLGETALDHADARRAAWQQFGIEADALSSTVLVAGCRPETAGPVGAILTLCSDNAQAAVLTLDQVRAASARWEWTTPVVHVVENPSVVAAAVARFGVRCPPLVCVSGWPSAAGTLLLRTMAATGTRIHYHGDLDGDGLRIAAHLVTKVGAHPWRLTTEDYREALSRRSIGPSIGRVVPDVPWDDGLAPAMRATGIAVTEESVIEDLLTDLAP
jgi:uncharacterized protein (TIGR02679 family)